MNVRSIRAALSCTGFLFAIACSDKTHKSSGFGDGISPKAIKAHLEFLADDALAGVYKIWAGFAARSACAST